MAYTREQMREYMRTYRARRIQQAVERLGGECARCGSKEQLEFDHIDPATKLRPVTLLQHASAKAFWAEVGKCQLLCHDCHVAKTRTDAGRAEPEHGSLTMYGKGRKCRCRACMDAWNAYSRAYRREWRRRRKTTVG